MKNLPSLTLPQIPKLSLLLQSLFFFTPVFSLPAQVVWDGGAGDDLFGSGANWVGDVSPTPGTTSDLAFAGSARLTPSNNYTAFDDFRNIFFNSGASSFTITGNAIDLFGKIENNSTNTQTFNLAIGTGSVTGGFIEMNPVSGDLNVGGSDVFLGNNQLRVYGNNGKTLTFGTGTIISGTGGTVAINQNSTVVYQSAHTYTGATFINAGKLRFAAGGSANSSTLNLLDTTGSVSAAIELAPLTGGLNLSSPIVIRSGSSGVATISSLNTSGTHTLSGGVTLNAGLTVNTTAGGTLTMSGAMAGVGSLTMGGGGTLNLSSQKVFTGGTTVNNGILDLTGGGGTAGAIRGTVTVNTGGTLRLSANDVTGYQGDATSLRTINLVGGTLNVNTVLGSTGNQTLGGATITMTGGTISGLTGSNLDMFTGPSNTGPSAITTLASATTSTISSQLRLRQNTATVFTVADGAAAIDLLVSGALVEDTAGRGLVKAGPGVMAFSSQKTYSGDTTVNGGVLDLTVAGNTAGVIRGTATVNSGGTLRFSAGDVTGYGTGTDRLATINLVGGTVNVNTTSNQTLGNATVNLTGGSITGIAGSNLDFFQTTSAMNSLASATTSTASGVQLSIRQTAGLTITTAAGTTPSGVDLDIASVITSNGSFSAAPLIKAGLGSLKLSSGNTYTGATNINAGKLLVTANNGLGTTAAGTTLASGATLDFQNVNYATAEALTVNGGTIATSTGTSTFAGAITLGANSLVDVGGTQLTLSAAIGGGAFGLTKSGSGKLVLGGANSYSGTTLVNAGTLAVTGAATLAGNITLAATTVLDTSAATGTFTLGNSVTLTAGRASSPANDILGNLATGPGSTINILSGAGTVGTLTSSGSLTFGGGTVNFDLSNVVTSGNDKISLGGNLTISAATTLAFNRINNALTNGSYVLVQGTGAVSGSAGTLTTSGLIAGTTRQTFTLSTTSVANALTLDVAGSAANLIWNNAAATSVWSIAPADANWNNAGGNDRFFDADSVTFPDLSGQSTQTVAVTGTLTPATVTASNTAAGTTYTLNSTGKLTGPMPLTKSGDGVLILANTGGNDFTGATSVNAGTLRIGDAAAVSQGSTLTVASGAVVDVNGLNVTLPAVSGNGVIESDNGAGTVTSATTATIAAVLQNGTGGLSLVKNGTGVTSLTGANTYTGTTTISAGTLQIGNGGTTGSIGATSVTNNGTLAFNRSDLLVFANDISGSGAVNQAGSGTTAITGALTQTGGTTVSTGTLQIGNGGTIGSIAGNITTNATLAINRSDAVTLANLLSGTGGFSQLGTGTTTLTGANTYTGPTTVTAGVLSIASVANAGTASNIGQASVAASNLVLNGGKLQYTGATGSTNRGLTANNVAGNILEVTDSAATLTVGGTLSGSGGFTKTGNGTLTLAGTTSDMAGGLTVAAGIVNLTGGNNGFSSIGGGTLTINSGATVRAFSHNPLGQGTGSSLSPLVINGGTFESDQYNHINSITMTGGLLGVRSGVTQVDGMDMKVRNSVNPSITTNAAAASALISSKLLINAPLTFTVADGAAATDLEVSGLIAGGSLLTKAGPGKLVLSANNTASGGTTISAGTLQLGAGGTTGSVVGNITNNGALIFNRSDALSYGSTISGTGSVTKDGSGTLTLTTAQTYTGGTTVALGILQLNASLASNTALVINSGAELDVNATNLLFSPMSTTVNGTLKFIGGAHNHFQGSLTLNGGTISTGAGSTAFDSQGNYALDVTTVTIGGSTPSLISANTGIHLNGSPNFIVADATNDSSTDLTVSANLRNGEAGARGLTKSGPGTMTLTGTNTYSGSTNVTNGTLAIGPGGSLADGSVVNLTATSSFNIATISGTSETIANLNGTSATTVALGAKELILGVDNANGDFSGSASGTDGSVTKAGSGNLSLGGNNTYTGSTNLNSGTLLLATSNVLPDTAELKLSAGTKLQTQGFSDATGKLSVNGNSIIDLGTNGAGSTLTFSDAGAWTGMLAVWNWTGGGIWTAGTDKLLFSAGYANVDLSKVTFFSDGGTTQIGVGGGFIGSELVPVPEPTPLLTAWTLLGSMAWRGRRTVARRQQSRN